MVENNSIEIGIARLLTIPIVYSGLEKRIFYPNHHFARIAIPTRYTDYYSLIGSIEILRLSPEIHSILPKTSHFQKKEFQRVVKLE